MSIARDDIDQLRERVAGSFPGLVVIRFVHMTGIDRALVLSSQAFTALIPLLILVATMAPEGQEDLVSRSIIRRFGLRGDAADAVEQLFQVPEGAAGSVGVVSALLVIGSGASFARRLQKTYRAAWEQEKSGVRSGAWALVGLLVLIVDVGAQYGVRSLVRALPASWLISIPVSLVAGMVLWTSIPYVLLERRVHWRRLAAGGAVAALCTSLYAVATTVYMPVLVERYTDRFGLFGVATALIGWLLVISGIVVGTAALGAEFDASRAPWAVAVKRRLGLYDPALGPPEPDDGAANGLNAEDIRLVLRLGVSWAILTVAVWAATVLVPGIEVPGGLSTYFALSLGVGLVNALVGTAPEVVAIPHASWVVGVGALALNTLLLAVAAFASSGLEVDGVRALLAGGLCIAVATALVDVVLPSPQRPG